MSIRPPRYSTFNQACLTVARAVILDFSYKAFMTKGTVSKSRGDIKMRRFRNTYLSVIFSSLITVISIIWGVGD